MSEDAGVRAPRMAHPGRLITAPVSATQAVATISSFFEGRGFSRRSSGTADTAVLDYGNPAMQWLAIILPTELIPAARTWDYDISVLISTVEQTRTGCVIRVDASGATGDRPFNLFADTLDAAIDRLRLMGTVEVGEFTDRSR